MGYWPDPTPFEAEDGSVSASLDALIRGPGAALPGLLLVADPTADRREAARAAAVRLAGAWVGTGRRVVLADLELGSPGLHSLLGVSNEEGVADHFAFGTSVSRLAKPVADGAWSLWPAGAWVGDPAEILGSPGWTRLLHGMADTDATLLAFVPADSPALPGLAEAFGAVAILGDVPELRGVRPFSVLAVFQLPGAVGPAGEAGAVQPPAEPIGTTAASPDVAARAAPEREDVAGERESADAAFERIRLPTDARAREALIADLRYRQRAARMAPPSDAYRRPSLADIDARSEGKPGAGGQAGAASPDAAAASAQAAAVTPGPAPATPTVLLGEPPLVARRLPLPHKRSRAPLWWTVGVVLVLAALAAGWYFVRGRQDAQRDRARQESAGALEVPLPLPQAVTPAPATPAADTILAYAVSLGEHVRLPSAEQRVAQLRSEVPGVRFFVSPVVRSDALYYDVLAGPAGDSTAAAALLDSLTAGGRNGVGGEVRLAPYAFLLGEYATADSAEARVRGLRRLEIPSYAVPVAGPPARFRVYAGGYTGPVDAEVMKQILQSVGEPDVLVPRVGKR